MIILSRLSYCFYLTQYLVILVKNFTTRYKIAFTYFQNVSVFFYCIFECELNYCRYACRFFFPIASWLSHSLQSRDFLADMFFNYLLAFVVYILFEAPTYALDKLSLEHSAANLNSKSNRCDNDVEKINIENFRTKNVSNGRVEKSINSDDTHIPSSTVIYKLWSIIIFNKLHNLFIMWGNSVL